MAGGAAAVAGFCAQFPSACGAVADVCTAVGSAAGAVGAAALAAGAILLTPSKAGDATPCKFVREVYWGGETKTCVYQCPGYAAPVTFPQWKDQPCWSIHENGLVDYPGGPLPP